MFTKYLKDENILTPLIIVTWMTALLCGIIALIAFLASPALSNTQACIKFYGEDWAKDYHESNCISKGGDKKPLPIIEK